MRILILGGSGMVGHRLWVNLSKEHETWVTVRGSSSPFPEISMLPQRSFVRPNVDAQSFDEVTRALASIQPELVINCIGLVKQNVILAKDPLLSIQINALLPHRISMICRVAGIRMIHISTDCVFSGRKGHYTEDDQSDAEDLYGRTKFLGEVQYPHTITLRTSVIGREFKSHLGLIEWFLSQKENSSIKGFQKAIFTGVTTDEISRIIMNTVIPNPKLSGLYHVSSDAISKYEILRLTKEAFGKKLTIIPDDSFVCDRSLDSSRFRQITGYKPPSWSEMISELADNSAFYNQLMEVD
jgi:dTDP-4-dehydrorhamnose reductase